ncbi:MAG: DUF4097 family beta strand repeat-containing protein [Actinomycetota bacterium]|nr:DUF4097 family beta strand repeat-containing protein [Actinomycetota bacterium]MDQ3402117.1 DUF4097 family beta strand repeat-containing protein [Actinomycetota bacterium]
MPTFDTPEPISVTIDLAIGHIRITASDRADTIVDVRPSDAATAADVKAMKQTHVEYAGGRLRVKGPKPSGLFGKVGSIDLTIELPEGSHVRGDASIGDFVGEGRLGECRLVTSTGHIRLDHTAGLHLSTSGGDIIVDRAVGHTAVSTGTGVVRIRDVDGSAVIKNSNGASWVGQATGDLRLNAANGDISVDSAHADVVAKTANGSIRINEVVRGTVVLDTALGRVEVGIRAGTAAWLDVNSKFGVVRNSMDTSGSPGPSDETVEVRARTSYGDIVIRRS